MKMAEIYSSLIKLSSVLGCDPRDIVIGDDAALLIQGGCESINCIDLYLPTDLFKLLTHKHWPTLIDGQFVIQLDDGTLCRSLTEQVDTEDRGLLTVMSKSHLLSKHLKTMDVDNVDDHVRYKQIQSIKEIEA